MPIFRNEFVKSIELLGHGYDSFVCTGEVPLFSSAAGLLCGWPENPQRDADRERDVAQCSRHAKWGRVEDSLNFGPAALARADEDHSVVRRVFEKGRAGRDFRPRAYGSLELPFLIDGILPLARSTGYLVEDEGFYRTAARNACYGRNGMFGFIARTEGGEAIGQLNGQRIMWLERMADSRVRVAYMVRTVYACLSKAKAKAKAAEGLFGDGVQGLVENDLMALIGSLGIVFPGGVEINVGCMVVERPGESALRIMDGVEDAIEAAEESCIPGQEDLRFGIHGARIGYVTENFEGSYVDFMKKKVADAALA